MGHSQRKHALLSASGADRWMNCTPSARLEEDFPEPAVSDFALEGTLAHEFADAELRHYNGETTLKEKNAVLKVLRQHRLFSNEMEDQIEKYTDFVKEIFIVNKKQTPGAVLLIEEKIDFSHIVEDGFGTSDVTIIADTALTVIDLKYGKGIKVEAEGNPQLRLYGSGALRNAELLYDIQEVQMIIMQPRLDHVSASSMTVEDLVAWGEGEVKPKAELAYEGEGKQIAGDWCRWCKVKPKCRALADKNLALARMEFKDPNLLSDEEVLEVFQQQDQLVKWAESVSAYMWAEANSGKKWSGYKLVEGRSNRRWKNEEEIIKALKEKRFPQRTFLNTKLKGLGDIEKFLGPKRFEEILSEHIIKPTGKPTLVPESDKRSEIGSEESAKEDFKW